MFKSASIPQILPSIHPLLLTGLQPDCLHRIHTAQRFVLVFPLSFFSFRMYMTKQVFITWTQQERWLSPTERASVSVISCSKLYAPIGLL